MKMKSFEKLPDTEKETVIMSLKKALEAHAEISFAYVHGSFAKDGGFRDIDVAVYLSNVAISPLQYELALETECIAAVKRYPVDVRILNKAPLSFRYHVIKDGIRLLVRNDDDRTAFQEATLAHYFDFAPYRALYLKETLGVGV
jgi:predicted nucleotidyltransferase